MRVRRGPTHSAPAAAPGAARGPARQPAAGPRRGAHAGPPAQEEPPAPAPAGGPVRADRWPLRPRTVRARIVALLMVPVVSVMALWAFASVTTAQNIWDQLRLKSVRTTLLTPVDATVTGLQAERAAAGDLLAAPGATRENALREAAAATDRALAPLTLGRDYNRADAEGLGAEAAARVDALGTAVGALPALRSRVLARGVGWPEAYTAYGTVIEQAFAVAGAVTALQDHRAASDARVLLEFARARELLAREDVLLRTGQAAGSLPDDQLREFTGAVYARRQFDRGSAADLRPEDRAALLAITTGPDHRDLTAFEDRIRGAADGRAALGAVAPDRWALAAGNVARALRAVEAGAARAAGERSDPYALALFSPAGAAVLLGLGAVLASLLISVRIGRGLVTELIALRNCALELAGRKLPATMRRLRAGEEIDIEAEAPLPPAKSDEIGQVHVALGSVQRAAVTAAVERAEVLSGVSGVFVNLARRSQVLVHRQLTLLDAMERRTEDPAELADLFKIDHLTTRMRRHAEGLIILSGAAPGRAWRKPVPLLDVVRAAVAEVEEYARVDVHRLPFAAVAGPAVADLTHLVAELVENATGFSPPHTRVHIRGEQVGNGYALEIEDRGLGMGAEALADANRRIAAAEQSDLFDSDRLGLYVVSRLARRQQVRVSLRPSAYGGTTAVVLLPTALLESGPAPALAPRTEAGAGLARDRALRELPAGEEARAGSPGRSGRSASRAELLWEVPEFEVPDFPPSLSPSPLPASPSSPSQPPPARPGPLLPFGARGADPGVLRPTPFRASGARADHLPGSAAPPVRAAPPLAPPTGPLAPPSERPSGPPVVPGAGPGRAQVPPSGAGARPRPSWATPPGAAEAGASEAGPVVAGPEEPDELPRRVRQASLAPQLREAPPRPRPAARRQAGPPAGRDPEEARAAMAAYQQGWARGQSDHPGEPGGPGATGLTGTPGRRPGAPDRPSPEGDTR
ncbi:nitrate- and nitrite sensing domain-containing protein [Kitasatospora sp. NPDC050543]|uniref:sensor histidine kinase n=1 Tax=Kitasatospora sp. NPDC050543 TaxID=3364054 RepID=UPI0037A0A836